MTNNSPRAWRRLGDPWRSLLSEFVPALFGGVVVLAQGWTPYTPPTPTFQDVPVDHTFYTYIETAYHHNIISGYSCGSGCLEFRPGNSATRGQICKIAYLAVTVP